MFAKLVIDIDLSVADAADESLCRPELENAGFRLIFPDDLGVDAHRQSTFAEPNANLHVWSLGAAEPQRHPPSEIGCGNTTTSVSATQQQRLLQLQPHLVSARYNDMKAQTVHDIYDRIFAAELNATSDTSDRT